MAAQWLDEFRMFTSDSTRPWFPANHGLIAVGQSCCLLCLSRVSRQLSHAAAGRNRWSILAAINTSCSCRTAFPQIGSIMIRFSFMWIQPPRFGACWTVSDRMHSPRRHACWRRKSPRASTRQSLSDRYQQYDWNTVSPCNRDCRQSRLSRYIRFCDNNR